MINLKSMFACRVLAILAICGALIDLTSSLSAKVMWEMSMVSITVEALSGRVDVCNHNDFKFSKFPTCEGLRF